MPTTRSSPSKACGKSRCIANRPRIEAFLWLAFDDKILDQVAPRGEFRTVDLPLRPARQRQDLDLRTHRQPVRRLHLRSLRDRRKGSIIRVLLDEYNYEADRASAPTMRLQGKYDPGVSG